MFRATLAACGLALALSGLALAPSGHAAAAKGAGAALAPPFSVEKVRAKTGRKLKKPFVCPAPPSPMKDLQIHSFYQQGDETFSIVDPRAHAAYKQATRPISVFETGLAKMANNYVRSSPPRPDIAACALGWLAAWAEGGALLGDVNKSGEYARKWLLGSVASAWMQIGGEPALDPAKKEIVRMWMRNVARRAKADYSRDTHLRSRQNNHLYWAAWGVGAAGIALGDRAMLDWAVEKARSGINHIRADGALPLELGRGRRAFLYHLFAALPLFMLANAAEKNGIDLFSANGGALRRLGALCLRNLGHPAYFAELTQEEQDLSHAGTPSDLGWVEIYRQHYADPAADAALQKFRPMKHSRFGGNITLLYGQLDVKSRKESDAKSAMPAK